MFIESDFLNRFETFIEKRKQRTRSFQQKSKNFNICDPIIENT